MFNKWAQSRFPEMVFTGNCKSWCKLIIYPCTAVHCCLLVFNSAGKVFIPWPGTIYHFTKATEFVRWEDFDFVFKDPEQKYSSL
jgi:hypothetical protein